MKEKPDNKWNKGSGDLRARPHPAKFPACDKELKKGLSSGETITNRKLIQMQSKEGVMFQSQQATQLGSLALAM